MGAEFSARRLARLARQSLESEDIEEVLPGIQEALLTRARKGETGTGPDGLGIPARKRLAVVRALREVGIEAWTGGVEPGAARVQLHARWPEREDDCD